MRLMIRGYGIVMIALIMMLVFLQMMSFSVYKDELITCISTAMSSTQIIMQEQIEDVFYQSDKRRMDITSNQQYLELFATHFYKLVDSDASFEIRVYGIDYTKGFLDVEVCSSFKMFNGEIKTITSRKSNMVDVVIE